MARYRKIDTRIWNDERFGRLSDDAKLVFLFLLTHPHMTSLGAMRATAPGLAAELNWLVERFQKAFGELVKTQANSEGQSDDHTLVEFDDRACFIGLPNFLKYNGPESPNVVTSWAKSIDLLPECSLKKNLLKRANVCMTTRGEKFIEAWEGVLQSLPESLREGFVEPFPKTMSNQEPEPEQQQEHKQEPRKKVAAIAAGDVRPAKSSKPKAKNKTEKPIVIPAELDTAEFVQAWAEWKEHLRQKNKPMKPLQETKLLSTWKANGVERTIAAINHSIANGWQGLFEPNAPSNGQRTAQQEDPRGNFAAGERFLEIYGGQQNG